MLRVVALCLLVATSVAQNAGGVHLESILHQIVGEPSNGISTGSTGGAGGGVVTSTPPVINDRTPSPPQSSTLVPPSSSGQDAADTSCTTDNNEVGECVRYFLCDVNNNTVNTDGFGIIDLHVRDGLCLSYLDTCCLLPDKRPPENPITPKEEQKEGCGWRNPQGVGGLRIFSNIDDEAQFGEFPWMVAILKIEPVNNNEPSGQQLNVYVGGGSLIHMKVVLTAAHYVAKAKTLRVRAGEWDTQTTKEMYPYQERDVQNIEIHKDFNGGNLFYDVALLFLNKPMDPAPNIGVVCLPPPKRLQQEGTRCFASGWGKDKFGKEGRYQVILKKVDVPVVKHKTCQDRLRKTRLGRLFELHHSFMCAGGEPNKDSCKGDSGSPLVCPMEFEPDRYVQSGIVAWGISCGKDESPGVYVDVSVIREWIDDKMAGRGYGDEKVYARY